MKVRWRYSGRRCCCQYLYGILLVLDSHSHFQRHQQAAKDEVKLNDKFITTGNLMPTTTTSSRRRREFTTSASRRSVHWHKFTVTRVHDDQFIGTNSQQRPVHRQFTTMSAMPTSSLAQVHDNNQFISQRPARAHCVAGRLQIQLV